MWEWFGQILERLTSLIPRLSICRATHGGVKFRHGKNVREIRPGLYVHWPIVTEIATVTKARRTLNLESQTLTTKDNKTVTVTLTVVYRIEDVIKALVDTEDIEDSIGDIALEATVDPIRTRKFSEIREELTGEVRSEITRACRSAMRPFGAKVIKCYLSDFAQTTAYRIVGAGPAVVKVEE